MPLNKETEIETKYVKTFIPSNDYIYNDDELSNTLLYSGSYQVTSGISEVWNTSCFLSTGAVVCQISVSSKTSFGCDTHSVRLIIFVGLYHFS